jgi:hypothetical protein
MDRDAGLQEAARMKLLQITQANIGQFMRINMFNFNLDVDLNDFIQ